MAKVILMLAVITALVGSAAVKAGTDRGTWRLAVGVHRVVPFPYLVGVDPPADLARQFGQPIRAQQGVATYGHAHRGQRPKQLWRTPWHTHPDPHCVAPLCLPAYHRHRYRHVVVHPLPAGRVLERLARLDYSDFSGMRFDGRDYQVDALNRFGRPVVIIANGRNGQIRRVLR